MIPRMRPVYQKNFRYALARGKGLPVSLYMRGRIETLRNLMIGMKSKITKDIPIALHLRCMVRSEAPR